MSRSTGAGVPAAGAVALALALSLAGACYDVLAGPGLGTVFAACYVAGCVLAAVLVRRTDVAVAAVEPPLVYVVVALVASAVRGSASSGSWVVRHGLDLFTALVLQAPALLVATGAAVLVALVRGLGRRPAELQQTF